jgi:hypothetical protein
MCKSVRISFSGLNSHLPISDLPDGQPAEDEVLNADVARAWGVSGLCIDAFTLAMPAIDPVSGPTSARSTFDPR